MTPLRCTFKPYLPLLVFTIFFTSFPVYGWKWQENYGSDNRYIPLVESPGVAFIIIEPDDRSPAQRLLGEVFATWPYCVISSLLAAIAGIIIWFLVRNVLW